MRARRRKRYKSFCIDLSSGDRRRLTQKLREGHHPARFLKRALVLRLLDRGRSVAETAEDLGISQMGVRGIGKRYLKGGLEMALRDAPRPGKPPLMTDYQEKEAVALVCSVPPGERTRWTVNLLREELIRRGIVETVGRETLRTFLHESKVKPWLEKKLVHWGADRRIYRKDGRHP